MGSRVPKKNTLKCPRVELVMPRVEGMQHGHNMYNQRHEVGEYIGYDREITHSGVMTTKVLNKTTRGDFGEPSRLSSFLFKMLKKAIFFVHKGCSFCPLGA